MIYNQVKMVGAISLFTLFIVIPSFGQSVLNYATPMVNGPVQKIQVDVYTNCTYDAEGALKKETLNSCRIYEYADGLPVEARFYSGGGDAPRNLTSKFVYFFKNEKLVQVDDYVRANYFSKSADVILKKKTYLDYNGHVLSNEIMENAAGTLIARYVYCQALQQNEFPLYEWINELSVKKNTYGIRYHNGIVDLNYTIVGADTTFIKKGIEFEKNKWDFIICKNNDANAVEYKEIIDKRDERGNMLRIIRVPKDIKQKLVVIEYKYYFVEE